MNLPSISDVTTPQSTPALSRTVRGCLSARRSLRRFAVLLADDIFDVGVHITSCKRSCQWPAWVSSISDDAYIVEA
jgi:hypothetical protein